MVKYSKLPIVALNDIKHLTFVLHRQRTSKRIACYHRGYDCLILWSIRITVTFDKKLKSLSACWKQSAFKCCINLSGEFNIALKYLGQSFRKNTWWLCGPISCWSYIQNKAISKESALPISINANDGCYGNIENWIIWSCLSERVELINQTILSKEQKDFKSWFIATIKTKILEGLRKRVLGRLVKLQAIGHQKLISSAFRLIQFWKC